MFKAVLSERFLVLLCATAVVLGFSAWTGGTAAAATTPNQFTLCATGDYGARAVFPDRGGLSTGAVAPGKCATVQLSGNAKEEVEVFGLFNSSTSSGLGGFGFNDAVGGGADAAGTTSAPKLLRW